MKKQAVIDQMTESGVLPVFRTNDVKHLISASRAIGEAGIGCIEYTLTMPDVLALIRAARQELPKTLLVGAGTVLDGKTVAKAVRAGAQFIASPGCSPSMIRACKALGVPSVVGAITPTEVMNALKLGADVIKVFPAPSVGPGFFAEIQGPFPGVVLMAAGGMSPANLGEYVAKGAQIITCLANGLDAEAYRTGRVAAITRVAKTWVAAVRRAR
ncbi:MAG: bifunctional 4-hydroxy-2-oxoglutarate aldolase/2-dehydro-3-deoxy-phosphogluconate aldolase [Lentisphaerae bacterium]|nr:bifunctional 4-hydroxy-2-oxoglutarate aldolase/2-dehydro-3-deoxy-phosphogluconate aldolase [Lentisphaerota bacterium]